jgi:transposase
MRRLPVVAHLSVTKIRSRYLSCRHPIEKVRWHALWLLARTDTPRTPDQVADLVGLSGVTVREVLKRWNRLGPDGVRDGRTSNGSSPKLTTRQRNALFAALQKRPPDGGLWSGPKVARYVRKRWSVTVRSETGWRWLKKLGFTLQVPRPSHPKSADRPTQHRWKKTCDDASDV